MPLYISASGFFKLESNSRLELVSENTLTFDGAFPRSARLSSMSKTPEAPVLGTSRGLVLTNINSNSIRILCGEEQDILVCSHHLWRIQAHHNEM